MALPILDDDVRQVVADALDGFLLSKEAGGLAKPCELVYPGKSVPCVNCIYDSVSNRSSNRPRSGAPTPFSPGSPCPLCAGKGLCIQEVSETLQLKCAWEPRKFWRPLPNGFSVNIPNSFCEIKSYMTVLPKLMKADYIILNLPISAYVRQKYRMFGEPGDPSNIVQGRYCYTYWERLA